jgi:hypothetical protein
VRNARTSPRICWTPRRSEESLEIDGEHLARVLERCAKLIDRGDQTSCRLDVLPKDGQGGLHPRADRLQEGLRDKLLLRTEVVRNRAQVGPGGRRDGP